MPIKILADEDVDYRIVRELRQRGFEVISILEIARGSDDKRVLRLAKANEAILLTEDKDFGEWVFAYKEKDVGIVLLRYQPEKLFAIISSLIEVLKKHQSSLDMKFVVITPNKVRIRDL